MNYSTAVFLINTKARAIKCTYDPERNAPPTTFKTLDETIAVDDYVVVPTDTRHKMTVVKVTEVDVDVDFDSNVQMQWIVGTVDRSGFETTLAEEADAITKIKSAELRKKRTDLRNNLLADYAQDLKTLPIAHMNGDSPATPPTAEVKPAE